MEKSIQKETLCKGRIFRLVMFVLLSQLVTTPLRIFTEAVIEGRKGAPEFVTVPFIIYGICAELVFGLGYLCIGYRLPVKNTRLRAFAYMMLICFGSYLPNILAMAGGDGDIIENSLSVSIVTVDLLSYVIKGAVLGALFGNYAPQSEKVCPADGRYILACAVDGSVFALLNIITDGIAGAADSSWRLCGILGVSALHETSFYIVYSVFMFAAGAFLPLWFRYCMPRSTSAAGTAVFAVKLCAIMWLPNVLIMAFFGTSALPTIAYGAAYVVMFVICALVYRVIFPDKRPC